MGVVLILCKFFLGGFVGECERRSECGPLDEGGGKLYAYCGG